MMPHTRRDGGRVTPRARRQEGRVMPQARREEGRVTPQARRDGGRVTPRARRHAASLAMPVTAEPPESPMASWMPRVVAHVGATRVGTCHLLFKPSKAH